MAARVGFEVIIGTTFSKVIELTRKSGNDPATIWDITGFNSELTIRRDYGSAPIITLTEAVGTVITGALGKAQHTISDAVTATIEAGQYRYNWDLTAPDGTVTAIYYGLFTFKDNTNV